MAKHWCFSAIAALLQIDLLAFNGTIFDGIHQWAFCLTGVPHRFAVDYVSFWCLPGAFRHWRHTIWFTSKFNNFFDIMPFEHTKAITHFCQSVTSSSLSNIFRHTKAKLIKQLDYHFMIYAMSFSARMTFLDIIG